MEEHCTGKKDSDARKNLLIQDILCTLFRQRKVNYVMSHRGEKLMACKDIDAAERLQNILQVPLHWRQAYLKAKKLPEETLIVDGRMGETWNMWLAWWKANVARGGTKK